MTVGKLKLTSDFLSVSHSIRHLLPCLSLLSGVCRETTDRASQEGTLLKRDHWHSDSIVSFFGRDGLQQGLEPIKEVRVTALNAYYVHQLLLSTAHQK